jgi:hypothetical protein
MQGVIAMITFGFIWAVVGASGVASTGWVTVGLALVAAALAVGVYRGAVRFRSAPSAEDARPRRVRANSMRVFRLVDAAQIVLIVIVVFGLVRAGLPGLAAPATCLVVGLHFLPLAWVFDLPGYWWSGGLLMVVALAGAVLFAYDVDNAAIRSTVGLSAAVVLWATALHVAKRG